MNKTEAKFAEFLSGRTDVVSWKFEACKFKLANNCWYTPDFAVELADGTMRLIDVKAVYRGQNTPHAEDDALVKLKVVGEEYGHWYDVVMVWWQDGRWHERRFLPTTIQG